MVKLYTDKKGYKHFANSGKSVHRHVAERKLGGKIWPGYVTHHKDGNKRNNSRSNLQVMKRRAHSRYHAKQRSKMWRRH